MLAHFGPESKEARDFLRNSLEGSIDQLWAKGRTSPFGLDAPKSDEGLYDKIRALPTKDDTQRAVQAQALNVVVGLGQTRFAVYASSDFRFYVAAGRTGLLALRSLHKF
jgi:hypothetical protein